MHRRLPALLGASFACLIVAACGAAVASPSPNVTPTPTAAATEHPTDSSPTPAPTTEGAAPLAGTGSIPSGTYRTPDGLVPGFTFDVRADGWQSVVPPDQYGFVLAIPNAFKPDVLLGVVVPAAATADAFTAELTASGLLDASVVVTDGTVGGLASRSYAFKSSVARTAFVARSVNGDVHTSFGGDLAENRLIFVEHPTNPFVIVVSLGPGAGVAEQFVINAFIQSITFD